MAEVSGDSSAFLAGTRMIEDAQRSVVQVRSNGRGLGAGVIWPGDGLVMTNHHVVAGGRRSNVRVALSDGRTRSDIGSFTGRRSPHRLQPGVPETAGGTQLS